MQRTGLVDQSAFVSLVDSSISWAQLERGRLNVVYSVVGIAPLVASSRALNLAVQFQANLAPGKTAIANVDAALPGTRWFGQEIDRDSIALCNAELDLRTTGPSTASAIVVDERQLQTAFSDSLDASDLYHGLKRKGIARNPTAAQRLRRAVRDVCFGVAPPPRSAVGALIPLLAAALGEFDSHAIERTDAVSRRFAAVRLCEAYMREHLDGSVTLLDLSVVARMRSRTLINAFEAITGLSPMDYLKRLRLSAVHRSLRGADPSTTRIIDVAMEWGFWHMGHFTHAYRALFGQSPSQTLLE